MGKDSTATLQLVWLTLKALKPPWRKKPVRVISTDTLVENPVVAAWVTDSLDKMNAQAEKQGLPLTSHRLTPETTDTFWVNLIGRGYPAPRHEFRWRTERLKMNPSHKFIGSVVHEHGEAILVLGTRKAESSTRSHLMKRYEEKRTRAKLRSMSLSLSYVSRSLRLQRAESRAAGRQPPCSSAPRARVRDQAGGPRETRARWRRKRCLILAVRGSTILPCLA